MVTKPTLFLDVDGVLNVLGKSVHGLKKREVRLQAEKYPMHFYPTPFALTFMRWAWQVFDVQWCTAWRQDANLIAKMLIRLSPKATSASILKHAEEGNNHGL